VSIPLYTTLTRLKMSMNGGQMPPMTPVPVEVQKYIDPALLGEGGGLGMLHEDEVKGLRCPVRDCGAWHHVLTGHLNKTHGGIGGARAVKRFLSIPASVPLTSQRYRQIKGDASRAAWAAGKMPRPEPRWTEEQRQVALETRMATARTMGSRSLRNWCDAQIGHMLIDLQNEVGHVPTFSEAEAKYGRVFTGRCQRAYGTWTNARAQCGLQAHIKGLSPEDVFLAIGEYYKTWARLPTATEAQSPTRLPLFPEYGTILRVLEAKTWSLAMQRASEYLGIEDPRYSVAAA
jgi:hypothetical protein